MIMTNRCALNLSYCFTIISENHLRCGACSRHRWIWILTGSWILRTSCPCSCSWTSLGCSSSGPSDCAICFSTWILTPASPLPILISGCLRYLAPWTRFWRSPSRGCCDSFRLDCWLISAATQLCSNKSCPADFNWLSLSENISHLYYIIYQVGKWIILIRFFQRQKVQRSGSVYISTQHEKQGTDDSQWGNFYFEIFKLIGRVCDRILSSPSITPHDRDDYQHRIGAW